MSTRLQVVMSEAELDEIREAAGRERATVSEWVRNVLRDERERQRTGRPTTVAEAREDYAPGRSSGIGRVRLELDLRESLVARVQARYHLPSQRAAVEFALRRAAIRPMSKDEVLEMEGAGWDGDLDQMRTGDPGDLW